MPEGGVFRRGSCPKQDSIWPLPTIPPSKRNHRRLYIGGQPSPRRCAQSRSAASAINLISNALSASVSIPLYSSSFSSSSTLSQQTSLFSYILLLGMADLFNPWTSRNFQFFRVPRESRLPEGLPPPFPSPPSFFSATAFRSIDEISRQNSTCTDPRDQDAFSEIARYVTPLMSRTGPLRTGSIGDCARNSTWRSNRVEIASTKRDDFRKNFGGFSLWILPYRWS